MRLYRVHYFSDYGQSAGFEFFRTKREANAALIRFLDPDDDSRSGKIGEVEFAPTKAGVLDLLNRYADHPDNG